MYAVHMGKWETINTTTTVICAVAAVGLAITFIVGGTFGGPLVVGFLSVVTACVLEMLAFAFFGPDEAEEGDEDE